MNRYFICQYMLIIGMSLQLLTGCAGQDAQHSQATQAEIEAEASRLHRNGKLLIENGHYQEAIAEYDRLIALEPGNVLAYNGKAIAFDHSGNHLAAQDIYKLALAIAPSSTTIKNNLAMSLILNHQPQQAIALLEPLVKANSGNSSPDKIMRHNLAMAYGVSGQYKKATELNLMDMTAKQAQENIKFYKSYSKKLSGVNNMENKSGKHEDNANIGFISSDKPEVGKQPPVSYKPENSPTALSAPQDSGDKLSFPDISAVYSYPE